MGFEYESEGFRKMDRMMKDLNENSFVRFMGNAVLILAVMSMLEKLGNGKNDRPDVDQRAAVCQAVEAARVGASAFLEASPEKQREIIEMEKERQKKIEGRVAKLLWI